MSKHPTPTPRGGRRVRSGARGMLLGVLVAVGLAACGAAPAPGGRAGDRDDFVFTFIRTGPTDPEGLGQERTRELFAGHFGNMTDMAEAGQLLLAGPFGSSPTGPDLRGIFVFDTGDLEQGHRWASTDPPSQAGLFHLESYRWHADATVREVPARDQTLLAALPEEQRSNRGATARNYVLCIAPDPDGLEQRLAPLQAAGHLCLYGTLGRGTEDATVREGQALFVLGFDSPQDARDRAAELGVALEGIELHPWFASRAVEQLANPDS